MGWTIDKLATRGDMGGHFTWNHLVKVGEKTYTSTNKGKNYNAVDQLLEGLKHQGRRVVMDNGFPTIELLKDAASLWQTQIVATQRGNTAHLPGRHREYLASTKVR